MEVWKEIPGFKGKYFASNMGQIKSEIRILVGPKTNTKGYLRVTLNKRQYYVHRLVAITFLSNPTNLTQINHIDCNKLNNNINNLEWTSNQQNRDHAVRNDLIVKRDKNCTYQKLNLFQCKEIYQVYKSQNLSQKQIGHIYGVCQQTISNVLKMFKR